MRDLPRTLNLVDRLLAALDLKVKGLEEMRKVGGYEAVYNK